MYNVGGKRMQLFNASKDDDEQRQVCLLRYGRKAAALRFFSKETSLLDVEELDYQSDAARLLKVKRSLNNILSSSVTDSHVMPRSGRLRRKA